MARNEKLRKVSLWAAWLVCALATLALLGDFSGTDPLRGIRLSEPPMAPGTAFCLLLIGASLALQNRGNHPRLAPALSLGATLVATLTTVEILIGGRLLLRGWFGHATPASDSPVPLQAAVAVAVAGLAVAALSLRRRPARWAVSAWLANLLVAASVASLMTSAFHPLASVALSFAFGTHATLALLLVGLGVLLARPEEKFVSMLYDAGTTGVLARRLFIGTAVTPVVLTVFLLTCVRLELLDIADGVILLCGGLILCGAAISLYSTGAAVVIQEQREEAEQARLLLTARLQEQAAQLQETVGQRTRELQEANTSLRLAAESNALLALVAEHTTNGVVIADAAGGIQWVNAAFTRITGYALEPIKGRSLVDILPGPGTDPTAVDRLRRALERAEACHLDMLNQTLDHHPFWMAMDVQPVSERSGRLVNFIFVVVDITDERAAQQRLFSLNERLALATRSAALGVWEWDPEARLSQWDARTLEIYGLRPEQHSGRLEDWAAQLHPEDRDRLLAAIRDLTTGGSYFEQQFRIYRANDQSLRHIESRALVQRTAAGALVRVTGTDRDITAERDAAQQMALLNERLRLALRSSNFGVWEMDVATRRLLWDDRMCELYGIPRLDFDGTREFWRQRIHPLDRDFAFDPLDRAIAGASSSYDIEFRIIHPDGSLRHIEAHGYLQRDASGAPLRLVGLNRDITERKQLEERVKESEALAREVATIARIGGWEYDLDSAQLTWTDGMRLIHEVDAHFVPSLESTRAFYPESPMETWPGIFSPGDPGAPDFDQELRLHGAAGSELWVRILGRTEFGPDGRPARVHGTMQDVTARRESESSRRELEVQLFQAQKMETLGTLAGGIAHDFNNLLTGIIGYHELAADSLPEEHPARACLHEAKHASLRARELIEQILTFGRQSSNEGHVALDLVAVLEEGRRFLRSTLPANITIDLQIAPGLPPIVGDATQIHQVLLNLGSNAAHAMRASGGTLTVTAAPVENLSDLSMVLGGSTASAYVRLTVADTGHGMDEATRRRIFDPFFTTKNTREGTGLGLAVVHGIVRAHRGAIDVESRPGEGAKFHLYLPAATLDNEVVPAEATESPRGSGEFIIVVDDEEIVGTCTKLVLENKGYITAVFRSAEECLAAIANGSVSCSLLITDQTMPGMQGTELIATLRRQLPTLPVVLMSGYFSKISPTDLDALDPLELVSKPFTTDELTSAVHRALHPAK
jgi:PAS domain S-box-containing protein